MSYCINPQCPSPEDGIDPRDTVCPHCGSDLVFQNRYRINRLLGSGGFGKTFEALDGRNLKVIKVLFKNHPKAVTLFQQEAKVLSRLEHPGIPKVNPDGYFTYTPPYSEEPVHCLVMEKIEGLNLVEWLEQRNNKPIDKKQTVEWLEQLVEILEQVHQQHYFHRDIKPQNIMRRPTGQLVLIDFGTAREVTGTYLNKVGGGQNVTEIISAGYSPPEQINGKAVPQSDFYALGRTFVYLMTGKKPTEFPENPRTGKLLWREGAPQIPDALGDVIDYLMAPFPGNRPQHAQMILNCLAEAEPAIASTKSTLTLSFQRKPKTPSAGESKTRQRGSQSGLSRNNSGSGHSRNTGNSGNTTSSSQSGRTHVPHSGPRRQRQLPQLLRWPQIQISWQPFAALFLALAALSQGYGYWRYGLFPANPWDLVLAIPSASFLENLIARHAGDVQTLAIVPDGTLLVSGRNQDVDLIATRNNIVLQTRSVHESWIRAILVTPDGNSLITASDDASIRIWDLRTAIRRFTLSGHGGPVNALALSQNGQVLVSASDDGTLRVWDVNQGRVQRTLLGHTGPVNALALSADGTTLISGGEDQSLRIWDVQRGVLIRSLTGHQGPITAVALSPDEASIASAAEGDQVRLWNVFPGAELFRLHDTEVNVSELAFSPDGAYVLGAGRELHFWNLESGDRDYSLRGHSQEISSLVLTPDGRQVITGSSDGTIKRWNLPTEESPETSDL
ncbi:MAG: protein kinase [Phormidium sp. BM_Day4_Bin.17]|nr:protein kinase [Phormidium sp. BM_Day4_Bin.17]UCJ12296.1 MAG: serine/threonine protein kinase [Phormidium sp. PBR-2020]